MRRALNQDSTQPEVVRVLRSVGVSVMRINSPEPGCWDLLCGFRGRDFKLEVKGPDTPLSPEQELLHRTWCGAPTYVVRSPEEALAALGLRLTPEES